MSPSKADVKDQIARLNAGWTEPEELTFNSHGVETRKYQLYDTDGNQYGPTCFGEREFIIFLKGFDAGRSL